MKRIVILGIIILACGAQATELKSLEAAASLAGASIPLEANIMGATATIECGTIIANIGVIASSTDPDNLTVQNATVTNVFAFNADPSRVLIKFNY